MSGCVVDLRVTLPESWWVIPLIDPAACERSVQTLLSRHLVGSEADPLAGAIATELRTQVAYAAANHGRLLALNLQEAGGVPVAASLLMSWINAAGAGDALTELQDELAADLSSDGSALDLARLPQGTVLRRVHVLDASTERASLMADYWLERPDQTGLVHLAFGTPLLPVREAMLELFDAVVAAVRWVRAP